MKIALRLPFPHYPAGPNPIMQQGFHQSQSQSLQQSIAPQMQQSLKLLQVPTLELLTMIQQELVENPVLEMETNDISLEGEGLDRDQEDESPDFDEEFDHLVMLDDEWREDMRQNKVIQRRDDAEENHQFMLDSLAVPDTLQEHLLRQLGTSDASADDRRLGEILIGNLDDRGYLQTTVSDLALTMGIPAEGLRRVKALIQSFDPVGVCSEDLRDCLLAQLSRLGKENSLEFRIVDGYLTELAGKIPGHRAEVERQHRAGRPRRRDDRDARPAPRLRFRDRQQRLHHPRCHRRARQRHLPRGDGKRPDPAPPDQQRLPRPDEPRAAAAGRARIHPRKIRGRKFLIRSIQQRQDTIRRIAEEIVAGQGEFLRHGSAKLKPMNMAQIAERVGVHETTVSRAIAGKYMATPHGVFEMKYFFTPGYRTEGGEEMSNTSVKRAINELVKAEDGSKPLSDAAIVKMLDEKGIKIARRTVAKYRDELNILPSHLRKSF
ncbi:MAG: RNA polymerase sigma-54 factor [Verrucomicrobiales bacterium]